jgi:hypothetical protein
MFELTSSTGRGPKTTACSWELDCPAGSRPFINTPSAWQMLKGEMKMPASEGRPCINVTHAARPPQGS